MIGFRVFWVLVSYSFVVNDPFVMKAWAKSYPENKHVKFLADGSATYTHALGLELDLQEKGLGTRSRRFALLVDDLKVKAANIEGGGEFTVSSADDILKDLWISLLVCFWAIEPFSFWTQRMSWTWYEMMLGIKEDIYFSYIMLFSSYSFFFF